MIPKIIHFCWISGDPYPAKVKKCINSWKKYMPDYKIEIWDKSKCLDLNIPFINGAINMRKFAFAADLVRCIALYKLGGIYLDSDILLKKNLEPLLKGRFVGFMEIHKEFDNYGMKILNEKGEVEDILGIGIQAAVLASEKNHPYLKTLIDYYSDKQFNENTINYFMKFIAPPIFARILVGFGFKYKDEYQNLDSGIIIYPSEYIDCNPQSRNRYSFATHLCLGSWRHKLSVKGKIIYVMKRFFYLFLKSTKCDKFIFPVNYKKILHK